MKVLRFNVSKKIAQLNRVVQIFLCERADREFRLEYLRSQFANRFAAEFSSYSDSITSLQNELDRLAESTEKGNESLFRAKYETLVKEHRESEDALKELACALEAKAEKDLVAMAEELGRIPDTREAEAALAAQIEEFRANLQKSISNLKETHRTELETLRTESEKALNELMRSSDEKLAQLAKEHEAKLQDVRREFSGETPALKVFEETNTRMKSEIAMVKAQAGAAKAAGESMRDNFVKAIERFQQVNRELEVQYKADKKAFFEALELTRSKNAQVAEALKREMLAMQKQKTEQKTRLDDELGTLRNEVAEEMKKLGEEFALKKEEHQRLIDMSSDGFAEIQAKQKQEKDKFLQHMESEKRHVNAKIDGLSKKVSLMLEKNATEALTQRDALRQVAVQHGSEISAAAAEFKAMRDDLFAKMNAERQDLRREIEQSIASRSQTHQQHTGYLLDLQEKKNGMVQAHKNNCLQLETEESAAVDALKASLDCELEKLIAEQTAVLQSLRDKQREAEVTKNTEHEKRKQEKIEEMKALYAREMKRVESEFHHDNVISSLDDKMRK